MSYMLFQF